MRSTFSFRIIAPVIVFIAFGIIIGIVLPIFWKSIVYEPGFLVFYAIIICAWLWITFGEIRIRAIRAGLEEDRIVIRQFLGLGSCKTFYYSELDGFETKVLPARSGSYEYLFIKKNGKRVIRISQYYHKNYASLKSFLARKLRGKASYDTSLWEELRDMFG